MAPRLVRYRLQTASKMPKVQKMGAELWIYDSLSKSFEKLAGPESSLYEEREYNGLWALLNPSVAA